MADAPAEERAGRAAADLAYAVVDACTERYGEKWRNGDFCVILRAVNGADGLTFTWDWFYRPDAHGGGGTGSGAVGDGSEEGSE